jgi:hypothetical protein
MIGRLDDHCLMTAANWGGRAGWERRCGFLRWAIVASMIIGKTDSGSGAGAAELKYSSKRDQGMACHHWCRHGLPGPTPSTGTQHHCPYGLTRPTACGVSIPQAAPQFLPVARPRSGINTLIRV